MSEEIFTQAKPRSFLSGPFGSPYFWGALTAFGVIAAGLAYGIYRYQALQKELTAVKTDSGSEVNAAEAKKIIEEVSKLIELPADEEPTVAIVSDVSKLKSQPFFANAENGDRVLIYAKAKKAVLYRPTTKKLIEVGPVNLNQSAASASAEQPPPVAPTGATVATTITPTPSAPKVTFVLRNGTEVSGLAKKMEKDLTAKFANATITNVGNAAKRDYQKTLLVDVKGDKAATGQQIATSLGIELAPLPEGESVPASDFLIIVGADKQ